MIELSLNLILGLKKVTDDMKTHKNPELRASSIVKTSDKPKTTSAPKYGASAVKKPPQTKLDGNKWLVVSNTYMVRVTESIVTCDSDKTFVVKCNLGAIYSWCYF